MQRDEIPEVVALEVEDKPGGLDRLTQMLFKENINVNNAYGFVLDSWKTAIFVVEVDDIAKAQKLIDKAGFKTLDDEALSSVEPFHYVKY